MKKLITVLFFLCFAVSMNGQRGLFIKKDKETGITPKESIYEIAGLIMIADDRADLNIKYQDIIKFKLIQYIAKDTTMRLYLNIDRTTLKCLGANSKILIKTGDNVITLKLSGMKQCDDHLEDYAELSLNDIKLLKQNKMVGFKIHYKDSDEFDNEANYDDRCEQINQKYFIKTLKYFEK